MKKLAFPLYWALYYLVPLSLIVALCGFAALNVEVHQENEVLARSERVEVDRLNTTLELAIQCLITDLRFLTARTTDAIRHRTAPDLSPAALANEYLEFSRNKHIYDQVRYLDVSGQELIRVNYQGDDSILIPPDQLQGKSRRYYLQDMLKLNAGEIYISPMDLNIERGHIEVPWKPMVRFGMIVTDSEEKIIGVVVINYLARELLSLVGSGTPENQNHLLLNRDGFILKGRTPSEEWGFMFPDRQDQTIDNYFPGAWKRLASQERGQIVIEGRLLTFSKIHPVREGQVSSSGSNKPFTASKEQVKSDDYFWVLLSVASQSHLFASKADLFRHSMILVLPFWLLLAVSSWFLAAARERRKVAENELRQARDELEQRVLDRTRDLENSQNRITQILQSAGEGIYGTNDRGEVVFVNEMACSLFGWSCDELVGKNLHALVHHTTKNGEHHDQEKCLIFRTLENGQTWTNGETVFWTKEGVAIDVSLNSNPIIVDDQIVGAVVSFRDITEIKRAREQLLRLVTAIEQAEQGVLVLEASGDVLYANQQFMDEFEISANDLIGRPLRNCVGGGEGLERLNSLLETLTGGVLNRQRLIFTRSDRTTVVLEITLSPVVDDTGAVIGHSLIHANVTEILQLELNLKQSQKMESIGVLAGGIAHDFNNLLTAIRGYTSLASNRSKNPEVIECLGAVMEASQQAAELVSQIMKFSRNDERVKGPCDLATVIRDSLQMLRATLPSTIRMTAEIEADNLWVKATSTQLCQVLMNLATNAAHALKGREDGLIRVTLSSEMAVAESAKILGLPENDYVVITLSDNGHGIESKVLEKIFSPFFTTKKAGEGTGLGLVSVREIVQSSGGEIYVQSEKGRGTSFRVYLPRCEAPEDGNTLLPRPIVPLSELSGGAEHILFVEDERMLADLGREFLEALGYQTTVVMESLTALELFRENPMAFDLVITDYTMPQMTGLTLAGKIHELRPDLPIILSSGMLEAEWDSKSQDFSSYLQKPWNPDQLAEAIRTALQDKSLNG